MKIRHMALGLTITTIFATACGSKDSTNSEVKKTARSPEVGAIELLNHTLENGAKSYAAVYCHSESSLEQLQSRWNSSVWRSNGEITEDRLVANYRYDCRVLGQLDFDDEVYVALKDALGLWLKWMPEKSEATEPTSWWSGLNLPIVPYAIAMKANELSVAMIRKVDADDRATDRKTLLTAQGILDVEDEAKVVDATDEANLEVSYNDLVKVRNLLDSALNANLQND